MKAIIIDDELNNRENLSFLIKTYCEEVQIAAVCENADSGKLAIYQHKPDLVFLDIQMPGKSGLDLLKELDGIDFEIIFVTAFDQYGIQAVKFAALDYLLKPIDIEELKKAVHRADQVLKQKKRNTQLEYLIDLLKNDTVKRTKRIALPLQNETIYVEIDEIIRCEGSNTYTSFFLSSGECILVCRTLKECNELLATYGFIRSHQSHLVNGRFIKSWLKEDGGTLLLKDETKIPVSKPNRERVKNSLGMKI
ncbi:LytR/AlgR family response regulator transcription factor [Solitalea koreensis]|uniref:Two component transcriptional regulator, LytTR family n=1 Tax=Solitalea koreensis TaxID=543615 RepID=A0A521BRP3_9SPHI|nr:LytTR family DNA-binding domain-containing protein [Solitalea koreensis]SMO49725.1 two component transcriptional regulator, LytTR family [Solitalea koreensis]